MKKEFAINLGLLLIVNLFIKTYYLLGIDRQMQLALGTEVYGFYYKLLNVTLIFQFINDFGIQNYTNRFVSQNRDSIRQQYKDIAGLKMLLSFVFILSVFAFVWIMNYGTEIYPFIFHLAFNQILVSGINFARSNISGLGYYKTDSLFSVLDRILLILFGSLLLFQPYFRSFLSIETFVWIQTISLSLTLIVAFYFIRLKGLTLAFSKFDALAIKKILKACMPFAMIYLFSTLYNRLDVMLIGKLLSDGNQQAGIYASSMRLFEACSMISLSFGSLLLAMFSALHLDRIKLQDLFKMSMNILIVITIIIVMATSFYPTEIINLLYHHTELYWTDTFRLLMFAFIPASLNYIVGALLQAVHQEKKLVLFYIMASLLSLLVNLWAITNWKLIGAAYAAIVTNSLLVLFQLIYIHYKKLLEINAAFIQRAVLFVLAATLVSYGWSFLPVHWIMKLVLTCVSILIMAIVIKMILIRDFIEAKIKLN